MKTPARHPSSARPGITLIELTVVVLVLLSLISIFFVGSRAWKRGADRAECLLNYRRVQQAVRSHQNLGQLAVGAPLNVLTELVGIDKFLESEPECPGGGSYTYATTVPDYGDLAVGCSLSGGQDHVPGSIATW
jgi:type II secretory pathway pseudopilin PulG